ncbi:GIY-YIG nuclease family protein [Agromyces tardus]|uniref:GIY-YIG nuclease family protein n=1 Tax=Agromyces tardus TaxID=2583849 RepID=A0A3M8AK64_9MICO|nr:GIY-YIG nuclease family protein [Agromyces tardus]RNB51588.1 GIY-YIG nuclease family protein [Agromyces tardus]
MSEHELHQESADRLVDVFAPEDQSQSQPVAPVDEIRDLIREDQTRLGDAFRGLEQGLNPSELSELHNVATTGWVYNAQAVLSAAIDGQYSSSPSMIKSIASTLRSLTRAGRGVLSAEALALLTERLRDAERRVEQSQSSDEATESEEEENLEREVSKATDRLFDLPGIYAFSYGWYIEHPADDDRFLIKVGRAESVGRRIDDYRKGVRTHMPEPLALLRVYGSGERSTAEVERLFHRLLSTAGHDNPRRTRLSRQGEVGREWFLTNAAFLDACAEAIGLKTEHLGGSEFA